MPLRAGGGKQDKITRRIPTTESRQLAAKLEEERERNKGINFRMKG